MNPAFERVTGLQNENMVLEKVMLSVHPEDQEETESLVMMALVGLTTRHRCSLHGADGSVYTFDLSFSPLLWDGGCLVLCRETGYDYQESLDLGDMT